MMAVNASDSLCRAAAYHESAHIVIACHLGLSISPKVIHINSFGDGRAWFRGATDGGVVSFEEVDRVVIAIFAGGIAHRLIYGDIQSACKGDERRIKKLLETHYPDSKVRQGKQGQLLAHAKEVVNERWEIIIRVAEELWSKPRRPKNPHHELPKGKTLSASELVLLIKPVVVDIDENVE